MTARNGVRDLLTIRRPRQSIENRRDCKPPRSRTIAIHDPDPMFTAAVGDEGHLACIGRERWALLNSGIRCQWAKVRTVCVGSPKISVAGARRAQHHPTA